MKKLVLLLVATILFSNCATILNGKFQKVSIVTDSRNTVLVNGKKPKKKKGKYLIERDKKLKEITVKREGFKDEQITIAQFKKSPWHIMSWIPFVIVYAPFLDLGPRSFNYEKEIKLGKKMVELPQKEESSKKIRLNNVRVDLDAGDMKVRNFISYRSFKKRKREKKAINDVSGEKIEVENTVYSFLLNELLREKGYIDTTNKALVSGYLNDLFINATIDDVTITHVGNGLSYRYSGQGIIYVDLKIKWELLDYYKKPIHSQKTKSTSGQFKTYSSKDKYLEGIHVAIKDAMEFGLIEFMNSSEVIKQLNDKSGQEKELTVAEMVIPKPNAYVEDFNEAVESSVTIKSGDGHGSGFIISSEGHLLTAYHVIAGEDDLKVIMNNETEYDVEVIRVSKINDLALLKIKTSKLSLLPFRLNTSEEIEIASEIYVIGTPTAQDLSQTVSKGIISGIRKSEADVKFIQTDASINPGNSGGPIVNKKGIVIGVVNSKLAGFGIEGVAFGVPAYEIPDKLKIRFE